MIDKGSIKLEMKDMDTVAALRTLKLQSKSGTWAADKASIKVLMSLTKRFPSLDLIVQ